MVLLKNDNNTLPLSKEIKNILVLGPDATEARLGGYSGPGNNKISILEGLKKTVGKNVNISYEPGCTRTNRQFFAIQSEYLLTPDGETGLNAEYFDNPGLTGEAIVSRIDKQISFGWTLYSPHPDIPYDWFAGRWTGKIKAPANGTFEIGLKGDDGYLLYLNGKLVIDNWRKQGFSQNTVPFDFQKGKEYDIVIEYFETFGNAKFQMIWNYGAVDEENG